MKRKLLKSSIIGAFLTLCGNMNAQVVFNVLSPASVQGNYTPISYTSGWGADLTIAANAITGKIVVVDDGTTDDSLGCNTLVNASSIAGNIAMVYRYNCEFGVKALNAQDAGAIGVIVVNNGPAMTDPNAVLNMGPGAVGASVTIPVIMITANIGAALRPDIDAGTCTAFIGTKVGLYGNDLGFVGTQAVAARSFALPKTVAPDDSIYLGGFVTNFGYFDQSNVTLAATITKNSNVLYSQVSSPQATMLSGDSVYFTLPYFTQTAIDTGYYTITYTIGSDSTDNFSGDNILTTSFWVNDSLYSKSRINPTTGVPMRTGSYKPTNALYWGHCIVIDEKDKNNLLTLKAVTFATASNTTNLPDITGQYVAVDIYEWTDADNTQFNSVNNVISDLYTYSANLQNQFVTQTLSTPLTLLDNTRYLVCIDIDNVDMYLGYDEGIDYTSTINQNQEYYFPLSVEGVWDGAAFGGDIVPAIIAHVDVPLGIKERNLSSKITPYPNPAQYIVNIPLNEMHKGTISLKIYDIVGKLVKSEEISMSGKFLTANVSDISNGSYIFNLTFEDKSQTSFKVSINK